MSAAGLPGAAFPALSERTARAIVIHHSIRLKTYQAPLHLLLYHPSLAVTANHNHHSLPPQLSNEKGECKLKNRETNGQKVVLKAGETDGVARQKAIDDALGGNGAATGGSSVVSSAGRPLKQKTSRK